MIKGKVVEAQKTAKLLVVTMDSQLRCKEHISATATKGLVAAMALKRLGSLASATARGLFEAIVASIADYASAVWQHACGESGMALLMRIQRIGAQAITGVSER